ncbi:MAG TPA: PilZ domain-containing protein [Acidobacteriaceae bacterium]|jgi:hypothetical protein|nr:PilZ domain-containing protein [Acidobacteriaceae bacterium]
MTWIKIILDRVLGKEKRNAERKPSPELSAYYWDGGRPTEHAIRDISSTGLFLMTEERMYPGTIVVMTLQKKDRPDGDSERVLSVQSKAVRCDSDGVGLEFVLPEFDDPRRGQKLLAEGTDRKALKKFLEDMEGSSRASVSGLQPSLSLRS